MLRARCSGTLCVVCWSGPLVLDEALEVAKSVSNGDPNAVLFALLPMQHASTDREIVKKNNRQLDDKIFGNLILISDRIFLGGATRIHTQ